MATMEIFKADYRDNQVKGLLREILHKLQILPADGDVLFGSDKSEIIVHPKFKEIHFVKKIPVTEKKKEKDDLVERVVGGTVIDSSFGFRFNR